VDLGLAERVVIVTGGSSGIGYAVAKLFAQEGARVIITARGVAALEVAARELSEATQSIVLAVPSDTTEQARVDQMVGEVLRRHDRVDILVNCAANPSGLVRSAIEELDSDALLRDLNTKVVGYARCARAVVPAMKQQRWGRIINIGGLTGRGSDLLSGMRNVAICHLTKTLSDQLGPQGITVNVVHPGVIRTPHLTELFSKEAQKWRTTAAAIEAGFVARTPTRRILEAEEIAHAVAFLASAHGASITGESLAVDGGITRGIFL
jgi:NAD(P)-dependent dehydrogenase (short-subunit alcohol dehydrogenase family)